MSRVGMTLTQEAADDRADFMRVFNPQKRPVIDEKVGIDFFHAAREKFYEKFFGLFPGFFVAQNEKGVRCFSFRKKSFERSFYFFSEGHLFAKTFFL